MDLANSTITIVGLGLMGGSLGKALCRSGICGEVRALVRNENAVGRAVAAGAAHVAGPNTEQMISGTDILVLCSPVCTIEKQVTEFHRFLHPGSIVTDMGSVKKNIVQAMNFLPEGIRSVGGHPMCGKEISGLSASDPDLFKNKFWVLTPTNSTDSAVLDVMEQMIVELGAKTVVMDADTHDAVVASISHLPYLLAGTLVAVAEEVSSELPNVWTLASSGFRDTSRVAAGNLEMMIDILSSNKSNIVQMLTRASGRLNILIELLTREDFPKLKELLTEVRERRMSLFKE